jgi:ADP-ribose pyrophosphatase YjhB (NUDIX family)
MSDISTTSAGCIVYKKVNEQIEFLLIFRKWEYRPEGAWILPKGTMEIGETPEQTALRETTEETGYNDLELETFLKQVEIHYEHKGTNQHKIINWFLAKLISDKKEITNLTEAEAKSQVFEIHWIEASKALDLLTFDSEKESAVKALEYLKL